MDPKKVHPGPQYDEEVARLLPPNLDIATPTIIDQIQSARAFFAQLGNYAKQSIESDPDLDLHEQVIPGPAGDLLIVIVRKAGTSKGKRAGFYHIHRGGLTAGTRYGGIDIVTPWVRELDAVAVAVEYRLPPEHQHPAPVEDCYAGLVWMHEHAEELGIDPEMIMIEGQSAGGGLAAATALLARDKGGPPLCAQLIGVPVLDDRNQTVSSAQYTEGGSWNSPSNAFAWKCLLGDLAGGDEVSPYASPARATDLHGLPPTFIDVSCAEPSRDEAVAHASRLWECGVQAELHVWPGGPHAFDVLAPGAAVSKASIAARTAWVKRNLSSKNLISA